jgi:AraC family transcriptional regulator
LDRARRLLATTGLPIKAVAADCGFCDQAHLTRMFSAEFGETPAVFRRKAH